MFLLSAARRGGFSHWKPRFEIPEFCSTHLFPAKFKSQQEPSSLENPVIHLDASNFNANSQATLPSNE